jgi:hypothetical protein
VGGRIIDPVDAFPCCERAGEGDGIGGIARAPRFKPFDIDRSQHMLGKPQGRFGSGGLAV